MLWKCLLLLITWRTAQLQELPVANGAAPDSPLSVSLSSKSLTRNSLSVQQSDSTSPNLSPFELLHASSQLVTLPTTLPAVYDGCFDTCNEPTFHLLSQNSITNCLDYCIGWGGGIQITTIILYKEFCTCNPSNCRFASHEAVCDFPCPGNASEICGGFFGDYDGSKYNILDFCASSPCGQHGICSQLAIEPYYLCACTDGYTGDRCQKIDGGWSDWSAWTSCSVTCGYGTIRKFRNCTNPAPAGEGRNCTESAEPNDTESHLCSDVLCAVNGSWTEWGAWGACSVSCGTGTQLRQRFCTNPCPANGGANCSVSDSSIDRRVCNNSCVDGEWADWSAWTACSVTCDYGSTSRYRNCTNPAPAFGGRNCSQSGESSETESHLCSDALCVGSHLSTHHDGNVYFIVNGAWTEWGAWEPCSVSCGRGTQIRKRICTNVCPSTGEPICPVSDAAIDRKTCSNCTVGCERACSPHPDFCDQYVVCLNGRDIAVACEKVDGVRLYYDVVEKTCKSLCNVTLQEGCRFPGQP